MTKRQVAIRILQFWGIAAIAAIIAVVYFTWPSSGYTIAILASLASIFWAANEIDERTAEEKDPPGAW